MAEAHYSYDNVERDEESIWKWTHPVLGTFRFEELGGRFGDWSREGSSSGIDLTFYLEGSYRQVEKYNVRTTKPPRPSDASIALAMRICSKLDSNPDEYKQKIAQAFWNDIHGIGEAIGGVWWSNELDEVKETWQDCCPEPFPNSVEEMVPLTRLTAVRIIEENALDGFGFYAPYWVDAELSEIEPEHGIGMEFSKEDQVLSLGYTVPAF